MIDLKISTKGLETGFESGQSASIELKALAVEGEFEGYASIFGNLDDGRDIVMPGCFADSLIEIPANKVKMLWYHNPAEVIGKYLEIREDNKGVFCRGKINLKVQKGAEVYELLKDGALDGLSIGYRTTKDDIDRDLGIRRILKASLLEISVVTFPMNDMASVKRVKNSGTLTERELEAVLKRDAGLSATQAKALIAGGYKAMTGERDATNMRAEDLAALAAFERMTKVLRG